VTEAKLIAGKFLPSAMVEIAQGLDFSRLALSSQEAFVLSRVGSGIKAGDLMASTSLPEDQADAVLRSLAGKGCLVERQHPAMKEKVDLTDDRKREVLALEARLELPNPFQLLGLPDGAKPDACKAAYYDLSMRFHPDRYYGKNLGSFRPRIEKIFKRLTDAQLQLTDPDRRAALEKDHPDWFANAKAPEEKIVRDSVRAEDRARRIARHPYLAKGARLHEHLAKARRALESDSPGQALNELQLLLGLDPTHAEAKTLMVKVTAALQANRAKAALAEGVRLANVHDHDRALKQFLLAVEQGPSVEVCIKGLASAMRISDFKSAKVLATKWVELAPKDGKARLALADALHGAGLHKNAKREAEEALRLDPDNKDAKALLAKLRWA
jgi:tetratricopeptide (TPR) repeat protein